MSAPPEFRHARIGRVNRAERPVSAAERRLLSPGRLRVAWMSRPSRASAFLRILALTVPLAAAGCVKALPPTDTGTGLNPVAPDSPTTTAPTGGTSGTQTLAYDPDLKAVFASDCVSCHGGFRVDAGYSMTTYAQVMRAVQPGNPSSLLIYVTQRNGVMYPFFSGNRAAKAQMVYDWIVANQAAETR
jgi:hypothetical protein